jgi:ribose transport system substrate-binding protein
MAGALPRSRLVGTLHGIREILPSVEDSRVFWIDGNGQFGRSLEAVRKHLHQSYCPGQRADEGAEGLEAVRKHLRHGHGRHVLVSAINDPSALGALQAFEEAGMAEACAVMGQNASLEARAELRKPGTRFIGSVAYFPERYGEDVISLAIDILQRKPVPPAVFVKHQLLTKENVDHFYPNDSLTSPGELDLLLLRSR